MNVSGLEIRLNQKELRVGMVLNFSSVSANSCCQDFHMEGSLTKSF